MTIQSKTHCFKARCYLQIVRKNHSEMLFFVVWCCDIHLFKIWNLLFYDQMKLIRSKIILSFVFFNWLHGSFFWKKERKPFLCDQMKSTWHSHLIIFSFVLCSKQFTNVPTSLIFYLRVFFKEEKKTLFIFSDFLIILHNSCFAFEEVSNKNIIFLVLYHTGFAITSIILAKRRILIRFRTT